MSLFTVCFDIFDCAAFSDLYFFLGLQVNIMPKFTPDDYMLEKHADKRENEQKRETGIFKT